MIPARNEADNIVGLVDEIDRAMAGLAPFNSSWWMTGPAMALLRPCRIGPRRRRNCSDLPNHL